jgi:anaerobic ribonucleoside-triphosphate reductase activating protein
VLKVAGIVNETIVDGPGLRMAVYVQGCVHDCEGCHNPHTHSFDGGTEMSIDTIFDDFMKNPLLDGMTFSGGEPFCYAHQLSKLGRKLQDSGKSVVTYTGFTFEELLADKTSENGYGELLVATDYLIDGRFLLEQKDELLLFRGSTNQRIIMCKESLESGKVILYNV